MKRKAKQHATRFGPDEEEHHRGHEQDNVDDEPAEVMPAGVSHRLVELGPARSTGTAAG